MTAKIDEYLLRSLMQLQGHVNAGPSSDPNSQAMVDAILEDIRQFNKLVDAAASTETAEQYFGGEIKHKSILKEIVITPSDAVTANDTNFATLVFSYDDGAAGTPVTLATLTTEVASGSWVQGTKIVLTLANDNVALPAGSVLALTVTKDGSGVALPNMNVSVRLKKSEA